MIYLTVERISTTYTIVIIYIYIFSITKNTILFLFIYDWSWKINFPNRISIFAPKLGESLRGRKNTNISYKIIENRFDRIIWFLITKFVSLFFACLLSISTLLESLQAFTDKWLLFQRSNPTRFLLLLLLSIFFVFLFDLYREKKKKKKSRALLILTILKREILHESTRETCFPKRQTIF